MRIIPRRYWRKKWPLTDIYGQSMRSDIKIVSSHELENLLTEAKRNQRSAVGRPEFFEKQRQFMRQILLVAFGIEQDEVYRCIVTAVLFDGTGCSFTVDVSFGDFNKLRDIPPESLVEFAHLYLATFPPLKLDAAQGEPWHGIMKRGIR